MRITEEKPYPASYILGDEAVQEYIGGHAAHEDELTAFAASIVGAHFEAAKA